MNETVIGQRTGQLLAQPEAKRHLVWVSTDYLAVHLHQRKNVDPELQVQAGKCALRQRLLQLPAGFIAPCAIGNNG